MNEWINCRKKLPETGKDVLAYDGESMFVAWYICGEWSSFDTQFDSETPILAWMPLPKEPPTVKNIQIQKKIANLEK